MDFYDNHKRLSFNENGSLTIITGPVFSGKTEVYKFYNQIKTWSVPICNKPKCRA